MGLCWKTVLPTGILPDGEEDVRTVNSWKTQESSMSVSLKALPLVMDEFSIGMQSMELEASLKEVNLELHGDFSMEVTDLELQWPSGWDRMQNMEGSVI